MDTGQIVAILAAAGHPTRFAVLRLLGTEEAGLAAGEIARRLGVVQNTMSSHLKKLAEAGIVDVVRSGTTITYRLNRSATDALSSALRNL
ncbi:MULTISPECIES: metalloregulator ArsR/SmtB family transcription factor [unclassified Sphingomonas]|uniref:ArsR/SmtB family transcription factor n=1 Tax=unclassified Sphingomonas TaxID=196159 RepID=UPI000B2DC221|nr:MULTISPECIES: metalloregulator ArsR/SmtB family transcription factor [unclassified Sphingomonas]